MKLEEAIEIVLELSKKGNSSTDLSLYVGGDKAIEAANVVEDFFVNNVFDGTED